MQPTSLTCNPGLSLNNGSPVVWEPIPRGHVLQIAGRTLKYKHVPNVRVFQLFMQPKSLSCNPSLSLNKETLVMWEPIPRGQVL